MDNQLQCLEYSTCHAILLYSLQSLTASDVHLIASSVEHHPSLREMTVRNCGESLFKAAMEGMARRCDVELVDVIPHRRGEYP